MVISGGRKLAASRGAGIIRTLPSRAGLPGRPWYNRGMLSAFRVLWRALVHFYDESLLLIRANVVWFVGSVPLFLLVLAICWLFVPTTDPESGPIVWPLWLAGLILLSVPSPFAIGIYALAAEIVRGETPEFGVYWVALRRWWRRGLVMFAIGGFVLGALVFNTAFYLQVTEGILQAVSVLWLYAILFWITLQTYLVPLLLSSAEETARANGSDQGWGGGWGDRATAPAATPGQPLPLRTLYKRAAILALANPIFSLVLVLNTVLIMALSTLAVPIYPLVAMAYVALVGARALRHLRRKYLPEEVGDEDGEGAAG